MSTPTRHGTREQTGSALDMNTFFPRESRHETSPWILFSFAFWESGVFFWFLRYGVWVMMDSWGLMPRGARIDSK